MFQFGSELLRLEQLRLLVREPSVLLGRRTPEKATRHFVGFRRKPVRIRA